MFSSPTTPDWLDLEQGDSEIQLWPDPETCEPAQLKSAPLWAQDRTQFVVCLLGMHKDLGFKIHHCANWNAGACLSSQHSGSRVGSIRSSRSSLLI